MACFLYPDAEVYVPEPFFLTTISKATKENSIMSNIPGIKKPSPAYSTLQQHNDDVGKEPHTPTTDGQRPPFRHRTLALTAAIFGYFLFAYDNTVIANIHPNIVEELGDIANLPLLSVSYNLSAFAANLLWGQLYRNFDGKWLFCVAVAVFEIGCEVCGAAPSMGALVGGRAIAGLGTRSSRQSLCRRS